MEYLVLRRFRSFGKLLVKGMVVDESEIRSPRLRMAEGKITPAVSSSTVPAEPGDEPDPPGSTEGEDKSELPTEPADDKQVEQAVQQPRLHYTGSALKYTDYTLG